MKLVLLILALAAVFTANCRGNETNHVSDGPVITEFTDEDQTLYTEHMDTDSTEETPYQTIRPENLKSDEEFQQLNMNDEMSMLHGRSRWCKSMNGVCRRRKYPCEEGYQASPFGRPYCTGRKRRCCYPDTDTTTAASTPTVSIPGGFEFINGRYVLVTKTTDSRLNYQRSVERCTSMGAIPFIPYSQRDFDFIVLTNVALSRGDIWIPFSDIQTEGQLKWTDNTDASNTTAVTWCHSQQLSKNSEDRDCGMIYRDCTDTVQMTDCSYTPFPMICAFLF